MTAEFEVVIVGAGHNGLVAGTYLAKAGRRVLILERGPKLGGMTSSGFMIPEAPGHVVTPCAVELIFVRATGLIEEFDLPRYGLRTVDPDPSYVYLHPDGNSIAVFRDPRRTAEDMARLSRADGKAYLEFAKLLDALVDIGLPVMLNDPGRWKIGDLLKMIGALIRNRRLRDQLSALTAGTADQIACEWFEHPASIALLTGIAAGAGPIDDDGNAAAYMIFGMLHRVGVGKPIGSMQSFSNALGSAYAAAGGSLQLNSTVAEILIEDGKARGVRLEDGSIVKARVVLATCDPRTAFQLATPTAIERRMRVRMEHAPAGRANVVPFLANVAMSGPLRLRRHQERRTDGADLNKAVGLMGTPDEVRDSFAFAKRGEIPPRHAVSMTPLSNGDPTQAPPGQSLAYIYLPAAPVVARGGWPAARDRVMESVLAQVGEFYEGFDREIGRFVEAPPDRAARLNVTNGCVTHIDFASSRTGSKRPAYGMGGTAPVVPGFFLGGAGIHPGGGVSGLPGRISASRVLRYLRSAR
ncbi:MAG TPA: NAD(P)/FAD-dependent oxidoreductase [Steroidobacteraceae bacterium]